MSPNPARPSPGAFLARFADLPDPGAVAVDFEVDAMRYSLILARRGDDLFAYENVCPHSFYPLDRPDGRVVMHDARFLVCSHHGASFALETGACAGGPCSSDERLQRVDVRVVDGDVVMGSGDRAGRNPLPGGEGDGGG